MPLNEGHGVKLDLRPKGSDASGDRVTVVEHVVAVKFDVWMRCGLPAEQQRIECSQRAA